MGKLINMQSRKPFSIRNKGKVAELDIYSAIGDSFWEDSLSAKDVSKALKDMSSDVTEIVVRINSPGGDVFDGLTIYNRLVQHPAKVTVYIDGLAASIASIIALAGDEVIMGEGALFMIHKPMSGTHGNAVELMELVDRLDMVEDQLIAVYRKKTGMSASELRDMLAKTTWLEAEEALSFGFVDRTMELNEVIDIAASAEKATWLKGMPKVANHNQEIRNKLNEFKSDVEGFLARPKA